MGGGGGGGGEYEYVGLQSVLKPKVRLLRLSLCCVLCRLVLSQSAEFSAVCGFSPPPSHRTNLSFLCFILSLYYLFLSLLLSLFTHLCIHFFIRNRPSFFPQNHLPVSGDHGQDGKGVTPRTESIIFFPKVSRAVPGSGDNSCCAPSALSRSSANKTTLHCLRWWVTIGKRTTDTLYPQNQYHRRQMGAQGSCPEWSVTMETAIRREVGRKD